MIQQHKLQIASLPA